jgi:hypothetical protein
MTQRGRLMGVVLLILGLIPALVLATTRCSTTYHKILDRYDTVCSDGTRAVSRYNPVLKRFDATITASPRPACTGQMNARTQQAEVRCR